jgi:hypothetical protein
VSLESRKADSADSSEVNGVGDWSHYRDYYQPPPATLRDYYQLPPHGPPRSPEMTIPITPRNPLSNPRSALAERTNVQQHPIFYDASPSIKSWFPPPKGVKCKRKLDTLDRGDRKRVKLSSGECSDGSDAYENSSDTDSEAQMQGHRRKKSVFSTRFTAPAQSFRRPIGLFSLTHSPF